MIQLLSFGTDFRNLGQTDLFAELRKTENCDYMCKTFFQYNFGKTRNCTLRISGAYSYVQLKCFQFGNFFQCKDCKNNEDNDNFLEQRVGAVC